MAKRFVYVLKNSEIPPRYYTGLTSNLAARIAGHSADESTYTAKYPAVVDRRRHRISRRAPRCRVRTLFEVRLRRRVRAAAFARAADILSLPRRQSPHEPLRGKRRVNCLHLDRLCATVAVDWLNPEHVVDGRSIGLTMKAEDAFRVAAPAIGLAIGIPIAFSCVQFVKSQVYEMDNVPPAALLVAVGALLGAALVAGVIPGRRAASIDPAKALRTE